MNEIKTQFDTSLIFFPIIHQKKKAICWIIYQKKVFEAIKIKKKKKRLKQSNVATKLN